MGEDLITVEDAIDILREVGMQDIFNQARLKALFLLVQSSRKDRARKRDFGNLLKKVAQDGFENYLFRMADRNMNGMIELEELKVIGKRMRWDVKGKEKEVLNRDQFLRFIKQHYDGEGA